MNESDLENELRALRPVDPSPGLEERIAEKLAQRRASVSSEHSLAGTRDGDWPVGTAALREWFHRLGWALAGAIAAIIGMTLWQSGARRSEPAAPSIAATAPEPDALLADDTESEFLGADESGILYTASAEPFRQMRFLSVERTAWTDPDTGARIAVEIPREDIVSMPVAMQ
jgi:hypothetical protein